MELQISVIGGRCSTGVASGLWFTLISSIIIVRMRLFDNTLALHRFEENNRPPYVILSHRWGRNEASYEDYRQGRTSKLEKVRQFNDFLNEIRIKASKAVRREEIGAYLHAHSWFWIDTCCINENSSAEQTEAINSMFQWYKGATVCYAYLADVHATDGDQLVHELEKSSWFKRGWTLQELLAPKAVTFVNCDWQVIGSKEDTNFMQPLVSRITGIPQTVLSNFDLSRDMSVKERMGWRRGRKTTRIEDEAYCLLGIFDISMSVIYGEGEKAMIRLREEIGKAKKRKVHPPSSVLSYASLGPSGRGDPSRITLDSSGTSIAFKRTFPDAAPTLEDKVRLASIVTQQRGNEENEATERTSGLAESSFAVSSDVREQTRYLGRNSQQSTNTNSEARALLSLFMRIRELQQRLDSAQNNGTSMSRVERGRIEEHSRPSSAQSDSSSVTYTPSSDAAPPTSGKRFQMKRAIQMLRNLKFRGPGAREHDEASIRTSEQDGTSVWRSEQYAMSTRTSDSSQSSESDYIYLDGDRLGLSGRLNILIRRIRSFVEKCFLPHTIVEQRSRDSEEASSSSSSSHEESRTHPHSVRYDRRHRYSD